MDIYSTKERNEMIQQAMDRYKYNDFSLEIDDFFAINKSIYIYKVVKNENRLRLLKCLPEFFIHGDYYDKWDMIDDKNLKDILNIMSCSDNEKRIRFNFINDLKNNFNINNILETVKYMVRQHDKMLCLSIYINTIFKIYESGEFSGYRNGDIFGIYSLRDILKYLP